jgi:2-polyprenyl-6-methoxyphenol hydroxylase-like FAD-dependent oxidoreductase
MMVAMLLARAGVRSVIVNAEPRPTMHPKGSTQNARTLEHYRSVGLAPAIRAAAVPGPDSSMDIGYFTRLMGCELARITMPTARAAVAAAHADPFALTPEPLLRCNQMYVESLVFDHVTTLPDVSPRYGWHCTQIAQDASGVSAEIEHVQSGARETLRGMYLVGADGGRSLVRKTLGISYGGEDPHKQSFMGGTMISSHLRIPSFYATVPQAACWHYFIVNAEMRSNVVSLNGSDEFLMNSQLADGAAEPDVDAIARRFANSMGRPLDVTWLGHWMWTPGQALVADRYVDGRIALCGDAAHLFTPTGGFGMNTGIDDAANLAWKLAALVNGWGGAALLASYEAERRPIALRNTTMAKSYTRNMGNVPIDAAIEAETPAGIAARMATGAFLAGFREEFASIGIQLGARYDGSPIIASDGAVPPPDTPAVYQPSSIPGGRAPHFWLDADTSLFDRFGAGFTLLQFDGTHDIRALERSAHSRGIPLAVVRVAAPGAREYYGCDLVLVRPDQHIAWRGNAMPADYAAVLARITGW